MGPEVQSRLYVVAAAGADPRQLAAILDATGAATLLVTAGEGGALSAQSARPLVELAQSKEIAALIDGDAQLARTLRADGVHLPWSKDITANAMQRRGTSSARATSSASTSAARVTTP